MSMLDTLPVGPTFDAEYNPSDGRVSLPQLGFLGANAAGHRHLRKVTAVQIDGPKLSGSSTRHRSNSRPLPLLGPQSPSLSNGQGDTSDSGSPEPNAPRVSRKAFGTMGTGGPESPSLGAPGTNGQRSGQLSARTGRMPHTVPPLDLEKRSVNAWSPTRTSTHITNTPMDLIAGAAHGGGVGGTGGLLLGGGGSGGINSTLARSPIHNAYSHWPDSESSQKALMMTDSQAVAAAAAALTNPDVTSFMKSMAEALPEAAIIHSTDQLALHWFRTRHPDAAPTQRQDAIIARVWLEQQVSELKRALGLDRQSPEPSFSSASPSPQLGPISQGGNLSDDGQDSLLLVRETEGFVNATVLKHQEALLSKCMDELCGQVATQCMERGYLMHQLWQSMKHMMKVLLQDRELARVWMRDVKATEATVVEAAKVHKIRLEGEKFELSEINEILNRRLMFQKSDHEGCKARCQELEKMMEKISTAQPEVLQKSIDELRALLSASERSSATYQKSAEKSLSHIAEQELELVTFSMKLDELSADIELLNDQAAVRTPRPEQQQQPPWELLAPAEVALAQLALRQGLSPVDMHRLMLGVSSNGANLLPWFELAGSCRSLSMNGLDDPATVAAAAALAEAEAAFAAEAAAKAAAAAAPGGGRGPAAAGGGSKRGTEGDAAKTSGGGAGRNNASFATGGQRGAGAGSATPGSGAGPQRAGSNSAPGATGNTQQRPGQLEAGQPGSASARARPASSRPASVLRSKAAAPGAHPHTMHEMYHWLRDLLAKQHVPTMSKCLPEPVLEAIGQMMNHGLDIDSIASMLLGTLSPEGTDITAYKSLSGVLATKFAHTKTDIGGPITDALKVAAMSTAARMRHLEQQNKLMHRAVTKLKRAVGEQRRQEQHRSHQEAKTAQRKVTVHRVPRAIAAFFIQKRPEAFVGLGMLDEVPTALQFDGKVLNRLMEKGDAERLVNIIWQAKREWERVNSASIALADYVYIFFHKKYGTSKGISEASYNLIYSLGQHQYDPDCNSFLKIFLGEVEEAHYDEQRHLKQVVINALNKADEEGNAKVTGWLQKGEIRPALKSLFKDKNAAALEEVFDALDTDEPHEMVSYNRLFDDDEDLNQGIFAETIRSQHLNERLEFLQSVEDIVLDAADRSSVDAMTSSMMHSTLKRTLPDQQLTEFMQRVFGPTWTPTIKKLPPVPLELAVRLLRRENVHTLISLTAAMELSGPGSGAAQTKGSKAAAAAAAAPESKAAKKGIVWGENSASEAPEVAPDADADTDAALSAQPSNEGSAGGAAAAAAAAAAATAAAAAAAAAATVRQQQEEDVAQPGDMQANDEVFAETSGGGAFDPEEDG